MMSNHQRILRGISIGGAILTAVLIVLLFVSVFVSLIYNARSQARRVTHVSEANDVKLQFDYPSYLFQQENPTALRINVWTENNLPLLEPLSVRLNIPEGIQIVTPTVNANDRVVELAFLPEDGGTKRQCLSAKCRNRNVHSKTGNSRAIHLALGYFADANRVEFTLVRSNWQPLPQCVE
ncbi:MAG: hypothetical protein M5U34_27930 [Chloroflexi bacterium]|nr:hypothetical protein [Chloroflexota bacterium]